MNEKVKKIINKIKGITYVNIHDTYHRITNEEISVLETTINNQEKKIDDLLKWKDSQQDLIKGKDEHIARLLNQNKELRDENKELVARNAFRILTTEDSVSEEAIKQFKERFEKMSPITGANNVEIEYNGYKAIEQEIGIDLITLSKLKKNGGYFKVHNKIYFCKGEDIYFYCYTFKKDIVIKIDFVIENVGTWNASVLRYGKSWALTKEELEAK